MERITFEIDNETKRKIKSRLGESGHTIKQVFGDFCTQYAELGLSPGRYISIDNRRKLPNVAAVYFLVGDDEDVLYIGATKQLKKRLASHHRLPEFKDEKAKVFWIEANNDLIFELESELIEFIDPELNLSDSAHRPRKYDDAMTEVIRARVTPELAEWVRSQEGNQADVIREALELLRKEREEQMNAKCPECGSDHINLNASVNVYDDDFKMYTCQNCYHRFNDPDDEGGEEC